MYHWTHIGDRVERAWQRRTGYSVVAEMTVGMGGGGIRLDGVIGEVLLSDDLLADHGQTFMSLLLPRLSQLLEVAVLRDTPLPN
jgi:hypothetical protein